MCARVCVRARVCVSACMRVVHDHVLSPFHAAFMSAVTRMRVCVRARECVRVCVWSLGVVIGCGA